MHAVWSVSNILIPYESYEVWFESTNKQGTDHGKQSKWWTELAETNTQDCQSARLTKISATSKTWCSRFTMKEGLKEAASKKKVGSWGCHFLGYEWIRILSEGCLDWKWNSKVLASIYVCQPGLLFKFSVSVFIVLKIRKRKNNYGLRRSVP